MTVYTQHTQNPYIIFYKNFFSYYYRNEEKYDRLFACLFLYLTVENAVSVIPYKFFTQISGPSKKERLDKWESIVAQKNMYVKDKIKKFFIEETGIDDITNNTSWYTTCDFINELSDIRNGIVHGHIISSSSMHEGGSVIDKKDSELFEKLERATLLQEFYSKFWSFIDFYIENLSKIKPEVIYADEVKTVNINMTEFGEAIKQQLKSQEHN